MPAFLDIPKDIIELLLQELILQQELKSIKSLALCCKALLPLCRRHIFSFITLEWPQFYEYNYRSESESSSEEPDNTSVTSSERSEPSSEESESSLEESESSSEESESSSEESESSSEESERPSKASPEELALFFGNNPDVSGFVKHLELCIMGDNIPSAPSLLRVILSFHRIHTFVLFGADVDPWVKFPQETKDAIMHVLSLPTLSNLYMCKMYKFPASAFTACSNLLTLDLDSTDLSDSESTRDHKQNSRAPSIRSFTASGMHILHNTDILMGCDSSSESSLSEISPIIDFTDLQHLTIKSIISLQSNLNAATEIMKTAHSSIRSVTLHFGMGIIPEGVAACIRDSGVSNLECFITSFIVSYQYEKPFTIFCDELLEMSLDNHSNGLTDIQIEIKITECPNCDIFQDWERMDKILSGDGFRRLVDVSITVLLCFYDSRINKLLKGRMEMLTFPGLRNRSDSIQFTYNVDFGRFEHGY